MNPVRSVRLHIGSVSSEFTSGNCAKTLKKPALRRQLALCEAQVQSISPGPFGFLPTAGRRVRGELSDSETALKVRATSGA